MFNLISKVTLTRKHIGNNFARSNYTLKECISRTSSTMSKRVINLGSLPRLNAHGIWSMIWMPVSLARANGWNGMDTSLDAKFTPTIKLHLERGRDVPHLMPFFKRPLSLSLQLVSLTSSPPPLPSSFHIPNNNRLATPSRKGKRNRRRNSRPHRVNACTFAFVAPAKSARMHLWTTLLVIIDCSTRHLLMHSGVNDHFSTVFLHGKISSSRFFI